MQSGVVSQKNVERIAARIIANELEFSWISGSADRDDGEFARFAHSGRFAFSLLYWVSTSIWAQWLGVDVSARQRVHLGSWHA
jgi:hypothetical protein